MSRPKGKKNNANEKKLLKFIEKNENNKSVSKGPK